MTSDPRDDADQDAGPATEPELGHPSQAEGEDPDHPAEHHVVGEHDA